MSSYNLFASGSFSLDELANKIEQENKRIKELEDFLKRVLVPEKKYDIEPGSSDRKFWIQRYAEAKASVRRDPQRIAINGVIYRIQGAKKRDVLNAIRELRELVCGAILVEERLFSRARKFLYRQGETADYVRVTLENKETVYYYTYKFSRSVLDGKMQEFLKVLRELIDRKHPEWAEFEIFVYRDKTDKRAWIEAKSREFERIYRKWTPMGREDNLTEEEKKELIKKIARELGVSEDKARELFLEEDGVVRREYNDKWIRDVPKIARKILDGWYIPK